MDVGSKNTEHLAGLKSGWTPRPLGDSGSVMFEFAIVFPVFLTLVLLVIQLVLLVNARVIVSYAAFCAARSAAVTIPMDLSDERRNVIRADGTKMKDIRTAAAVACIPISPRVRTLSKDIQIDLQRLAAPAPSEDNPYLRYEPPTDNIFWNAIAWNTSFRERVATMISNGRALGVLQPAREVAGNFIDAVGSMTGQELMWILEKYPYSNFFTDVEIKGSSPYGDNAAITVTVKHPFYLNVPLVRRLLGRRMGESFYVRSLKNPSGGYANLIRVLTSETQLYYVMVEESSTMMNEGEPVNLPGEQNVQRIP